MKQAYVIGLGKSGVAAARLLKRQGWEVTVSDRNASDALHPLKTQLEEEGITVLLGHSLAPDPEQMQRIVVSPGVPWDLPVLVQARGLGIETLGEMELAWRSLSDYPWVAITGTNGKTTVTSLVAAVFQAAGLNAPACGNIGNAASELALNTCMTETVQQIEKARPMPSLDWVVAEVSSYQSEAASTLSPQIAIWTTFTPDHLSRHKTLENYYAIKAKLLSQAKIQILNGDDPHLRATGGDRWPHAVWTSIFGKANLPNPSALGAYIEEGWVYFSSGQGQPEEKIVAVNDLRMVGHHNQQNLLMAVAAARMAGIESGAIAQAIRDFPGVPHRLEHICTWRGIDFINDSKATNYDAAEVGLRAVQFPAILIAGGEAKEGDDTAWIERIRQQAAAVVLMGDAADAFAERLTAAGYDKWVKVSTMNEAVPKAAELAQQLGATIVLLSPACASFDQYPNFEARGDHFRDLCQAMMQAQKPMPQP